MQCDQAYLNRMRDVADPDADRLVELVLGLIEGESELPPERRLMAHLIEHDELPPSSFPPEPRKGLTCPGGDYLSVP